MEKVVKDETGKQYGYLKVIERAENSKDRKARWKCICRCGKEVIVLGKKLRNGDTKSCGCYQKERAIESNMKRSGSLVGKRFGKLKVLSENGFFLHTSGRRSRIYRCLCDCGNFCDVQHQYLAYGDTTSCGCIRSKGETQIELLLKEHNINYKREFSFSDLKDKLPLRFDFAIFDTKGKLIKLIEFQGEQHTQPSNGFYNQTLIEHDKMKVEYCKENKIPLLHLYYKKNYSIKWEDLELYNGVE